MKRRALPKAEWGDDEDEELSRDREIANNYGFEDRSVTCARHDLGRYMQYYSMDPFEHHIKLRRDLQIVQAKILNLNNQIENLLEFVADRPREYLRIDDLVDGIRERAERIDEVREALPMRFEDIKKPAVKFLIAVWIHEPHRADQARDLNIKASAFDDTPSHKAMKFVREMFARFDNKILGKVSVSTMRRALEECGEPIPTPKQLAPHRGDPDWIS